MSVGYANRLAILQSLADKFPGLYTPEQMNAAGINPPPAAALPIVDETDPATDNANDRDDGPDPVDEPAADGPDIHGDADEPAAGDDAGAGDAREDTVSLDNQPGPVDENVHDDQQCQV